jgi:hypothetical protein
MVIPPASTSMLGGMFCFALEARPVACVALRLEHRSGLTLDACRIDAAGRFDAGGNVVTDDLRHEHTLELRAKATTRTGGVPHAEEQGRWAVAQHGRRMVRARVGAGAADLCLTERRAVVIDAVSQQRVRHSVWCLQRRDLVQVGELLVSTEVNRDDRELQLSAPPALEQCLLDAIGLGGDRVQEYGVHVPSVYLARFKGVLGEALLLFHVSGRKHLVGGAAGRHQPGNRANGHGAAGHGVVQHRERVRFEAVDISVPPNRASLLRSVGTQLRRTIVYPWDRSGHRVLEIAGGGSSLFTSRTQVLGLAEGAAYNRIEVARTARRFPVILDGWRTMAR